MNFADFLVGFIKIVDWCATVEMVGDLLTINKHRAVTGIKCNIPGTVARQR